MLLASVELHYVPDFIRMLESIKQLISNVKSESIRWRSKIDSINIICVLIFVSVSYYKPSQECFNATVTY